MPRYGLEAIFKAPILGPVMELYSPPHPLARLAVIIIAATLPLSAEEYIYASPHYEFICDGKLNTSVVKRFSLLFEATNQVCRELPLGMIKPLREERHKIHLFETREASTAKGGSPDSAGVCISRGGEDDILIPLTSLGVKKSRKQLQHRGHAETHRPSHRLWR